MSVANLNQQVRGFLDAHFPGSSIDDSYAFVTIKAPAVCRIKDDPLGLLERVVNGLCERPFLVIAVGVDPRPFVRSTTEELYTVPYSPDWNVEQRVQQWIVASESTQLDLAALFEAVVSPAALVFVDTARRIAVNAKTRRAYGTSQQELRTFLAGLENCIDGSG